MKVKIKKLNDSAVIPVKAHPTDAGMDLVATSRTIKDNIVTYGTGLAFEIPKGYVGLVFPRSSIYKTNMDLCNSVGVIDSGYRNEVLAKFYLGEVSALYNIGDRIAQMIIMPYPEIEFEESEELSSSDRGEGGFGSSGK